MTTRDNWRNRNPTLANALAVAIAALLVAVPGYGVLRDDFAVPFRHSHGQYYHFHGAAAWLIFAGFVCVAASVLVAVSRRLKAKPGRKTDGYVAEIMALAGVLIIMAMMVLKSMGVV